ncbi:hypothetical protein, partial [Burkholderia cepacia]|uniref:hypothetical protein n=1 Tax=Burkholderia cepacia TaxID=292 RepID=UPI00196B5B7E
PFGYLFDCLDLELIRVPLAAHPDLLGCHKLWLEDVYERLAGPLLIRWAPIFGFRAMILYYSLDCFAIRM